MDYEELFLYSNALAEEAASPAHGPSEHQSPSSQHVAAPKEVCDKSWHLLPGGGAGAELAHSCQRRLSRMKIRSYSSKLKTFQLFPKPPRLKSQLRLRLLLVPITSSASAALPSLLLFRHIKLTSGPLHMLCALPLGFPCLASSISSSSIVSLPSLDLK